MRQALSIKRALADARFRQPALPSFGVRPCHRGEIYPKRLRQLRWVGSCSPRNSLPLPMSATCAATIRG
jgi:hypothetical protein